MRGIRGFTLIELLIVMAILTLLAGILFTVFAGAKEKARQTHCMNNLKQLGAAILLYRQDYDGGWPTRLTAIYPQYVPTQELLRCPDDAAPDEVRKKWINAYGWYCSYTQWGDPLVVLSGANAVLYDMTDCDEKARFLTIRSCIPRLPIAQCCAHLLPGYFVPPEEPGAVVEYHERLRDAEVRSVVLRVEQDGSIHKQRVPDECGYSEICTFTGMANMTTKE